MPVVIVQSVTGLTNALTTAVAGETIELAPGTYDNVKLVGESFTIPVTITSEFASQQAALVGLTVANTTGVTFSNLNLTTVGDADPYYAFRVSNSKNIQFNNVNAYGSPTLAPGAQISGFYISGSQNISILNSNMHNMNAAITANNDSTVTFNNNTFSALSKGGVEMGGSSNVTITHNAFNDFLPSPGIHSDAVQLYTQGTTVSASNINISNNTITRGAGSAIQGIFLQDEVGTLPYQNVTIANNVVAGETWNSIYVNANVTGSLRIVNNTVESWAGTNTAGDGSLAAQAATTFGTSNFLANISVSDSLTANVTETGNVAQGYQGDVGAGNITIGAINPLIGTPQFTAGILAIPHTSSVTQYGTVAGSLLSGDTGTNLYVADVGETANAQAAVRASGSTFQGAQGVLTVNPNGTYSYTETSGGLIVGAQYIDTFYLTVASSNGPATTTSLQVAVTGTGSGNGMADTIIGGSGAETFAAFGAKSVLISGNGPDTYVFSALAQSTPTMQTEIKGFKAGDVIDLSALDPSFHVVNRFDGHADELILASTGSGNWTIMGDTTGSGKANFELCLLGVASGHIVTAADFHF